MLILQEKVFHVDKKKVDVAQKSISCRQKRDDAASKKYFVHKKVVIFPERRTILENWNISFELTLIRSDYTFKKQNAPEKCLLRGMLHIGKVKFTPGEIV